MNVRKSNKSKIMVRYVLLPVASVTEYDYIYKKLQFIQKEFAADVVS